MYTNRLRKQALFKRMVFEQCKSEASCSELDIRSKPLKRRGLSRFYAEKSQSFASLESLVDCRHGKSARVLAKRSQSDSMEGGPCSQGGPQPNNNEVRSSDR